MIITEQTNHSISLAKKPEKIISLVPSQTELLIFLGLEERLVGRTKFCIHPKPEVESIPIVGGTKNYRFETIRDLKPDLIIGNLEENEQEGIEKLREEFPVWLSDIRTFQDAVDMISKGGEIVGKKERAEFLIEAIQERVDEFHEKEPIPTVYLIWKDPFMAAGSDTFIHEMMGLSGFRNLVQEKRYPELSLEEIKKLKPELVMLSSEPYPFKEKHVIELQEQLPGTRVVWVDGEMFSWYGNRLIRAMDYLQELYNELVNS